MKKLLFSFTLGVASTFAQTVDEEIALIQEAFGEYGILAKATK